MVESGRTFDDLDVLRTEQSRESSKELGYLDAKGVIDLLNAAEVESLRAVEEAAPRLAKVAEMTAEAMRSGGRVFLLAAGASGHVVVQEASEIPGTFGVGSERFKAIVATSSILGDATVTASEDDTEAAPRRLLNENVGRGDVVIGVAASGSTPFVRAGICSARDEGAWTCGIANNPAVPLFQDAEFDVLLNTGPEVLTGSTRLKAATSQKLALNRISTAAMVLNGRVYKNYMIDVIVRNAKLKKRAVRMVADLCQIDSEAATAELEKFNWSVRDVIESRS